MTKVSLCLVAVTIATLCVSSSCRSGVTGNAATFGTTLRDYARKAKQRGSHEALVPYAADEQEGDMLIVRSIGEAMNQYEWIVGEPIEEKTLTIATTTNSVDPDSIFTVYRLRVVKRFGRSKHARAINVLETNALREMPVADNQVLLLKSGGNTFVDGVLLKKRGSPCFSELLPRPYLLGLAMDDSDRIGWLKMGCRAIYAIDGDRLTPRDQEGGPVTVGMNDRFGNSLAAFSKAFESSR